MAYCPSCGQAASAGASFCAQCGASLAPAAPVPAQAVPPAAAGRGARPLGIAILAVVDFLAAGLLLVVALFFLGGGAFLGALAPGAGGALLGALAALGALVFLLLAAVFGLIGWGLWEGRGWAWTLSVVLTALGVLGNLLSLAFPKSAADVGAAVFGLVLGGLFLWYYTRPGVKRWFGKAPGAVAPPAPTYVPPPPPA